MSLTWKIKRSCWNIKLCFNISILTYNYLFLKCFHFEQIKIVTLVTWFLIFVLKHMWPYFSGSTRQEQKLFVKILLCPIVQTEFIVLFDQISVEHWQPSIQNLKGILGNGLGYFHFYFRREANAASWAFCFETDLSSFFLGSNMCWCDICITQIKLSFTMIDC